MFLVLTPRPAGRKSGPLADFYPARCMFPDSTRLIASSMLYGREELCVQAQWFGRLPAIGAGIA
jgi:hypothetical protein